MEPTSWASRAQAAADSVDLGFGHRLFGSVPRTRIASVTRPARRFGWPWDSWHYWWQAHYLDCLVDAAWRRLAAAGTPQGPAKDPATEVGAVRDLLAGIRLRNLFQAANLRYRNTFFDDMAWLALSAGRAERLAVRATGRGLPEAQAAVRSLTPRLVSAATAEAGGGVYWNTRRVYKNTAATAPAALHFARTGERERAQGLLDWLDATLLDPAQGLYLDGINLRRDGSTELVTDVWTYNQGPVLGAFLALGGAANLARAEALVAAVGAHLTVDWQTHDGGARRPLRGDGGGDAGLFMGILARNLAEAAASPDVSESTRGMARRLVLDTAESLWAGAEQHGALWTFPQKPGQTASDAYPEGSPVELSTQLQAWMVLEAAHRLTHISEGQGYVIDVI